MAEKISMIIVQVDLDCHKCYKKICNILCQLQDCERIQTISFDHKNKTITIVGPFDSQRLASKLRCKGGKVIRDIHIVDKPPQKMAEPLPPSSPQMKNGKQKRKEKPPPSAADEPPSPQPDREMSPPRKEKPRKVKERSHPPVEYVIPTVEIPSWPAPPVGPCGCPCCAPCYQGYYVRCRCCSCGRAYALAPAACHGYRGYRTFSDEDPMAACTVM